jgi:hypothetical protein
MMTSSVSPTLHLSTPETGCQLDQGQIAGGAGLASPSSSSRNWVRKRRNRRDDAGGFGASGCWSARLIGRAKKILAWTGAAGNIWTKPDRIGLENPKMAGGNLLPDFNTGNIEKITVELQ